MKKPSLTFPSGAIALSLIFSGVARAADPWDFLPACEQRVKQAKDGTLPKIELVGEIHYQPFDRAREPGKYLEGYESREAYEDPETDVEKEGLFGLESIELHGLNTLLAVVYAAAQVEKQRDSDTLAELATAVKQLIEGTTVNEALFETAKATPGLVSYLTSGNLPGAPKKTLLDFIPAWTKAMAERARVNAPLQALLLPASRQVIQKLASDPLAMDFASGLAMFRKLAEIRNETAALAVVRVYCKASLPKQKPIRVVMGAVHIPGLEKLVRAKLPAKVAIAISGVKTEVDWTNGLTTPKN